MRAMSLVSSDADGEQNEIRNLQEKLESTMKLVSNLSGQLTELKEQVGCSRVKALTEAQTLNALTSSWRNHEKHVRFLCTCGQRAPLEVCLFAAHCPLDAALTKCKRRWVIVCNTAHEAVSQILFSSLSNKLSLVPIDLFIDFLTKIEVFLCYLVIELASQIKSFAIFMGAHHWISQKIIICDHYTEVKTIL